MGLPEPKRCMATALHGRPCSGWAIKGSDFCFFHDPATHEAVREAGRRGNASKNGPAKVLPDAAAVKLESVDDVLELIGDTVTQMRRGELDTRIGNGIGFLMQQALKALEQKGLVDKVREVETAIAGIREAKKNVE